MQQPFNPDLSAPPEWQELDSISFLSYKSYVSGEPNGNRIRMKYYRHKETKEMLAKVWFGPGAQGPPGQAHGGSTAAVMDEGMGIAAWLAGHLVLAAKLNIEYKKLLPLGTVATLQARVVEVKGIRVKMTAELIGEEGEFFCKAEGLFIKIRPERLGEEARKLHEKFLNENGTL
ncbi:MAG: PaaI family thioesterase [Bacteroidota bacterium]|nr:PaaI family thioesterase [Bacteroidota bacterium]